MQPLEQSQHLAYQELSQSVVYVSKTIMDDLNTQLKLNRAINFTSMMEQILVQRHILENFAMLKGTWTRFNNQPRQ